MLDADSPKRAETLPDESAPGEVGPWGADHASVHSEVIPAGASSLIVAAEGSSGEADAFGDVVDTDWAKELLPDGPPPPPPDAQPSVGFQLTAPEEGSDVDPFASGFDDVVDTDWAKEFLPDGPPLPPEDLAEGAGIGEGTLEAFQWAADAGAFGGAGEGEPEPDFPEHLRTLTSPAGESPSLLGQVGGEPDAEAGPIEPQGAPRAGLIEADVAEAEAEARSGLTAPEGVADASADASTIAAAGNANAEEERAEPEVAFAPAAATEDSEDLPPEEASVLAGSEASNDTREEDALAESDGGAVVAHEATSEDAKPERPEAKGDAAITTGVGGEDSVALGVDAVVNAAPGAEELPSGADVAPSGGDEGLSGGPGSGDDDPGEPLAEPDAAALSDSSAPRELELADSPQVPDAKVPGAGQDLPARVDEAVPGAAQDLPTRADEAAPGDAQDLPARADEAAESTASEPDPDGEAPPETVDTDWAEELLPDGPPPPPPTDGSARPDGLRALAEGSSEQRFGFSAEELAILDGLERLAKGIDEESAAEKVRPARMMASVVRLLLRKGLIDERELLDELSRG
jgi:hypothetical protein